MAAFVLLTQYCAGDKIEKNEMDWACGAYGCSEGWGGIGCWWGNRRERDHWGDLGVDGWIILEWISKEVGCGYMDWIVLGQDRDSAVMNLRVP